MKHKWIKTLGGLLFLAALPALAQTNHWYYPFDGNCADLGANAQLGVASPGVTFGEGHKGSCARFSGSDYVALPLDLNATADLSFSFWLRLDGPQPGPYYAMVLSSDADTFGRGFAVNLENNDYQVWLDDRMVNTGITPPAPGQWQHVCVTYTPGQATLYLNGQEAFVSTEYTNGLPFNDSTNLLVGLRNLFFDRGAYASVDELEIFDRTLSASEVAGLVYEDQTLLAHYRFEDDVLDSTPNACHGQPSTNLAYADSIHGRGLVLPPKPYVKLPINLNPYGAISFSFWMKIDGPLESANHDYGVFFSTDNNSYGRGLGVNAADNHFMVWYDDNFEYLDISVPETGLWRHVGMTYEPGRACFYIDGRQVHVNTQHTNPPPYNDATNITLGIRNLFFDRGANFSIDELRIYNQALSSNEMLSIFNLGLTVTGIVVEGTSVLKPDRTSAFSCYAYSADGQRLDVTGGAEFRIAPEEATNVAWFTGHTLHSGHPATDTVFQVYALYEHASGIATSAMHDVLLKTDDADCLLAYYPLDGNACDASGNAQDGAVMGANVSTDAVAGACYGFTGKNWISLPVNLNSYAELSYSLWFKITGTQPGPYYSMLFSTDNNTWGRGISITLTNSDFLYWFDDSWADTGCHTPTVGEWHQLACTYRPGENVFYFDGIEVYRDTAHTHTPPFNDATNILLGLRNRFYDRGFNGRIDEVKIYQCALSSNTVWSDYIAGASNVVNVRPLIQVAAAPTSGVAPCKVTFDFAGSCDSDGEIVRSEVDPESDGIYEQAIPGTGQLSVDYLRPGIYQTSLRVVDNFGAMAATTVRIAVGGQAPEVVLSALPAGGTAPLAVTFQANVTLVATNVPILSYAWDFDGDGAADKVTDGPEVQHEYGAAGTYSARVCALDAAGVVGQDECIVTVSAPPAPPACTPALEFFPHTGFSPLAVQLCVLYVTNCSYREIAWDFDGNGQVDEITGSATTTNLYAEPGKYWPVANILLDDGSVIVRSNLLQISECTGLKVWISQPTDGQVVSGNELTLHANTAPGDLTGGVRFQYRIFSAPDWQDIGTWIEPPPCSFKQGWDVSAFPAGTLIYLRAIARDVTGAQVCSDTIRVQVENSVNGHPKAVRATDDVIQCNVAAEQRCDYSQADGFGFSVTPLTADTNQVLTVSQSTARSVRTAATAGRTLLPQRFDLDFGTNAFNQAVQLVIPYADANADGLVDGTWIPEATLDAFVWDETSHAWQKAGRSDIDMANNLVRTEVSRSGQVCLAGNPNLLLTYHGCTPSAAADNPAYPLRNLADGNHSSFWRCDTSQLPREVVYAFTNNLVAVIGQFAVLNAGGGANEFLKSCRIETSLDGTNFTTCFSGDLAASDELQELGPVAVTGRFVKFTALEATSSAGATLSEIAAYGALTADSDADGLEDVWELRHFGSLGHDGSADTDHDGLTDGQEAQLGFNPNLADTDGDGYPDRSEWIAGTDGNNDDDRLNLVSAVAPEVEAYLFRWLSVTGRVYTIMNSTNHLRSWAPLPAYIVHGDGTVKYFTNPVTDGGTVFYRLQVDPE